jgi:hypothetical protein
MMMLLTGALKNIASKKKDKKDKKGALAKRGGTEETKTSKPNSIVVKPRAAIVPTIKTSYYRSINTSIVPKQGGEEGSYGALVKTLDSVTQNVNTLTQIKQNELANEKRKSVAQAKSLQDAQKKSKEEQSEIKEQKDVVKNSAKIAGPKSSIFDGALNFLKGFVFSTAIMQLLNWFSDPKKTAQIFKFLEDNFVAMFIGTMAIVGTIAASSLLSLGGLLTIGLPLFFKLAGLLASILLSPPGLVALAALGLIAVFAAPTAKYDEITGPNAVWKQPGLKPAQRKAIIEGTFGHLTPDKWDPEALKMYKQTLQELKLDFDKSIAALEPQRARSRAIIEQQIKDGFFNPQTPAIPGQASKTLAAAAQSMKGFSSAAAPDGGRNGCVWAVNKVFAKAGLKTPWGSSNWVPDAENAMIKDGYQYIEPGNQQPGDLYIAPGQKHVGIVLDNGNIISNSSSKAAFSWEASPAAYAAEYGGEGKYYRMPAQVKPAQPAGPNALDQASSVSKKASYEEQVAQTLIVPVASGGGQQVSGGGGTKFAMIPDTGALNRYYDHTIQSTLYNA